MTREPPHLHLARCWPAYRAAFDLDHTDFVIIAMLEVHRPRCKLTQSLLAEIVGLSRSRICARLRRLQRLSYGGQPLITFTYDARRCRGVWCFGGLDAFAADLHLKRTRRVEQGKHVVPSPLPPQPQSRRSERGLWWWAPPPPLLVPAKKCRRCGEVKANHEFYLARKAKDGLCSWCKACKSEYARERRAANPEAARAYEREYERAWRERNRDHVRAYARAWRAKNPGKVREYLRRWLDKHSAPGAEQ